MFTTKVINIETTPMDSFLFPLIRTKSLSINTRMNVYANYSRVSSAVKRSLNLLGMGESTSVKLSELRDTINIYQHTSFTPEQVSVTGRLRTTTAYPPLPKQTVKGDTPDSNDIISWMRAWHEELRHDQQEFLELFMQESGCTRNEAKARTFGVRYGSPFSLHDFRKNLSGGSLRGLPDYYFGSLERRISGNKATSSILDDIFGSKEF